LDLQKEGFSITPLIGNHELMLIDSYYDNDLLALWLMNNGLSTLQSFGIRDVREMDNHYLDFFMSLKYYKTIGNLIFVHAGFDDLAENPFSDKYSMVWESRSSYGNPLLSGKTIIHGHRPKTISYINKLINEKSNVIPIDTGCVYGINSGYGFLSALELKSMSLYSVPGWIDTGY
jgi:serine/threonine protein phosphatase 1